MRLPALACVLFICAACSTTTTSENTTDSTEFADDTMEMEASGTTYIKDTTYTEVLAPSSFTSPQLYDTVGYVFSPAGLDVYAAPDGNNVVGKVDYRSKVILPLPLVNNAPADTMVIDGLKGHFVEIYHLGESGYVFSGYLVGMPVPEAGLSVIEYFTRNLHLVKPATRTVHECSCESESSDAAYEFENGVSISEGSGYENYGNYVGFRNQMTLQEVYLLARFFYTRLNEHVAEFPMSASTEEKEGQVTVTISASGEHITSIEVGTGEGCYEEEGVHEADNHIVMSANGGC